MQQPILSQPQDIRELAIRTAFADPQDNVESVRLPAEVADRLSTAASEIADHGGPDSPGAQALATHAGAEIAEALRRRGVDLLSAYAGSRVAALVFDELPYPAMSEAPEALPREAELLQHGLIRFLAARSQILLAAVAERAVAFDVENDGRIVRLVGNFAGGGLVPITGEVRGGRGASSQHGSLLAPHSEGPYHASRRARRGHSPAPSSLILTGVWNPQAEPTAVLPVRPLIEQLPSLHLLALAQPDFTFERSDSYTEAAEVPTATALVEVDRRGEFTLRYNAARVGLRDRAPLAARRALAALHSAIASAAPHRIVLNPTRALILNNAQAVHGRDPIADNRRLLVRLFGLRPDVRPALLRRDPRLLRG